MFLADPINWFGLAAIALCVLMMIRK